LAAAFITGGVRLRPGSLTRSSGLVITVAKPASYSAHLTELLREVHPERVNRATVPQRTSTPSGPRSSVVVIEGDDE
jgi:hypothetical protein